MLRSELISDYLQGRISFHTFSREFAAGNGVPKTARYYCDVELGEKLCGDIRMMYELSPSNVETLYVVDVFFDFIEVRGVLGEIIRDHIIEDEYIERKFAQKIVHYQDEFVWRQYQCSKIYFDLGFLDFNSDPERFLDLCRSSFAFGEYWPVADNIEKFSMQMLQQLLEFVEGGKYLSRRNSHDFKELLRKRIKYIGKKH